MGVKYKVGNSKESHGKTCYFCDIPHCFCIKWHTHISDNFHTCIRILEDQSESKPTANASDASPKSSKSQADTDRISISDTTDYSDVTSLLASNFNIMGDNTEANDAIAADLMALNQA